MNDGIIDQTILEADARNDTIKLSKSQREQLVELHLKICLSFGKQPHAEVLHLI